MASYMKGVNENAFKLRLPPSMQTNSMVNVEYLKLFWPSMLDGEEAHNVLSIVKKFALCALEGLKEDTIL